MGEWARLCTGAGQRGYRQRGHGRGRRRSACDLGVGPEDMSVVGFRKSGASADGIRVGAPGAGAGGLFLDFIGLNGMVGSERRRGGHG